MLVVVRHGATLAQAPAWAAFMEHARSTPSGYQRLGSSAEIGKLWKALEAQVIDVDDD